MESPTDNVQCKEKIETNSDSEKKDETESASDLSKECVNLDNVEIRVDNILVTDNIPEEQKVNELSKDNICEDVKREEDTDDVFIKPDFAKKRYSVDFKKTRSDFKRFSVDCSRNVATLEELVNLEKELARKNLDVRLSRRKSSGILKSTSDSGEIGEKLSKMRHESCSDDDDVFEKDAATNESEGPGEPPATPVGRDELALRRHRFFSDLVCAARAAVEHRVRFDPLGPVVADSGTNNHNMLLDI
ncbi:jg23969 [Pararge aegeria aegeria]|uniref:Jg23969 protein n=1 Tax=Pararge aegeria aegeria TaxID=348720 RepID=A0A8S4RF03_9NEOP|nr:jg23969 [Pararge aegeria aegeria]